jgi:DNA polymerase-3 subunit delta
MAEIPHKGLAAHLREAGTSGFSPVYLLHGEEVLYKAALDELAGALLPEGRKSLQYEPVTDDNVYTALERVNTFSLIPGTKVVAMADSRIFYAKQDETDFLRKVREAYDDKNIKKAARLFLSLLGLQGLSLDDVADPETRAGRLKGDDDLLQESGWLDAIVDHCREKGLSPTAPPDQGRDLQKAVEKGFPESHHLIITTDMVDRRRGLYKTIAEAGTVIDCSAPRGARKADREAQEAILRDRAIAILAPSGKRLEPAAHAAMVQRTGFDLRTFAAGLEKLIQFVGDRDRITPADVEALLKRTRQDPIYELTGALADRNLEAALFLVDSLLTAGLAPLQILAALANQIRKLLVMRDFLESPHGHAWKKGTNYNTFQSAVIPALKAYDADLAATLSDWDGQLQPETEAAAGKKKAARNPAGPATDLAILKNQKSPYPVYLLLQRAERFSTRELFDGLERLSDTDRRLKSTGQNPKILLETLLIRIIRGGDRS